MPYTPHTDADVAAMLKTIGADSIDDLFVEIPDELRLKGPLNIPSAQDEHRLAKTLGDLASRNLNLADTTCFLGAGIYDRFIPATVGAVISRGEFLTAYTPYQPEVSQGYLQTIYEFQSMVAELYDCDLANASMYDGPTSLAEAAIMACQITGRSRVVVSQGVHPHARQVLHTYCWALGIEVVEAPLTEGAAQDFSALTDSSACLLVQQPNFFGVIEDIPAARAACDSTGSMLVVSADPTACALVPGPGGQGADVVTGEGQPLGIPMGLGGPMLGLFACRKELVRQIPGRIVGRTTDAQGRLGYTMTLRTREQDIRREKATSNICTNEALMALAATVYLATLGRNGMRSVAESSVRNAQYAMGRLAESGASLRFPDRKVFCEFVVNLPRPATEVRDRLLDKGILAGLPLGPYGAGLENSLLVAVTELRTREEIDRLADEIKAAL
ncbi:MAG: aminomethyl-transferring glycine dehydrogenase subunit GcvPA [Fimbriimonadaceae bacterium]|nr:aminomethyl-transferring glycine dehydrogenase subunit GcvPA [Fimbriimonadaceae bacterium]